MIKTTYDCVQITKMNEPILMQKQIKKLNSIKKFEFRL